jgi:predicted ATP-dependent protease
MTAPPSDPSASATRDRARVAIADLRWRCPPAEVGVASTAEAEPIRGVIGQDDAVESLRFGLEIDAPGQNIYVRGLTGTGRSSLVQRLLEDAQPSSPAAPDRCFVHNFDQPDRPALITLPRGRGRAFRDRMEEFISYVKEQLLPALASDSMKGRRAELERRLEQEMQALGRPFEKQLTENDLALVMLTMPGGAQPAILPVIDGEPATPDRIQDYVSKGRLSEADVKALRAKIERFGERLGELNEKMQAAREEHRHRMRKLIEEEARWLLGFSVKEIQSAFPGEAIQHFLAGIVEDVITHQLHVLGEGIDLTRKYRVNPILTHEADEARPILVETNASLQSLLGTIDRQVLPGGGVYSDHLMIHGGTLLRADGGYLVLEARDVLMQLGAWRVLMQTLRTGKLEISPQESLIFGSSAVLKPEAIPVNLKVVLIGEPGLYATLDAFDPDFPNLFKVLADFDSSLPRDAVAVRSYTSVLARIAAEEELPAFAADAVAALAEHGARIAGRRDRLTARFGRLADLAREAAFLARAGGREQVDAEDVHQAIARSRRRCDLPARRVRELIADGLIRIQTEGAVVGQVNGLAVTYAGPLTFGFPARITATIGPGHAGAIDIEREAELSGSIHTKGFYILGGLLRHLLRGAAHPLAFSASVAFEQSYGGIDGDSASGAEMCCLLSALTGVGLRQGMAMTGAIDQLGHIQAVGAVTEKIEGFFEVCRQAGLTGEQGVVIPKSNVRDLMLRDDVVEACEGGRFHVWAVTTIGEALEILTGCEAGEADTDGRYSEGTLLARALERSGDFWRMAQSDQAP